MYDFCVCRSIRTWKLEQVLVQQSVLNCRTGIPHRTRANILPHNKSRIKSAARWLCPAAPTGLKTLAMWLSSEAAEIRCKYPPYRFLLSPIVHDICKQGWLGHKMVTATNMFWMVFVVRNSVQCSACVCMACKSCYVLDYVQCVLDWVLCCVLDDV